MRSRLAASLLALAFAFPAAAGDLVVGQPAPPIALHMLDGNHVSTADLRGKVVILHFWASWCVPCQTELPLLSDYSKHHDVQVLGLSLDTPASMEKMRKIAATLNFPVGLLGSAWAGEYGRIWRLPVTFVIDRDGILRHDGWQDDQQPLTRESLEQIVTPLLAR